MEYCKKHGSFIKWKKKASITDDVGCPRCLEDRIKELEEHRDRLKKLIMANPDDVAAKLKRAEDILKERDGGGHDADCKYFRLGLCNCGHQDVLNYFNKE